MPNILIKQDGTLCESSHHIPRANRRYVRWLNDASCDVTITFTAGWPFTQPAAPIPVAMDGTSARFTAKPPTGAPQHFPYVLAGACIAPPPAVKKTGVKKVVKKKGRSGGEVILD
jgi:hypothetical protein